MGKDRPKCPKCGSGMVTIRGRWTCLLCNTETRTRAETHEFYEVNKQDIQVDLRQLGRAATLKKWRIPEGSLAKLSRRWGISTPRTRRAPALASADNLVPGLPPWSDDWPEAVQLKWLEIFQGRLK